MTKAGRRGFLGPLVAMHTHLECRVLNGFYFFFLRPPLGPTANAPIGDRIAARPRAKP